MNRTKEPKILNEHPKGYIEMCSSCSYVKESNDIYFSFFDLIRSDKLDFQRKTKSDQGYHHKNNTFGNNTINLLFFRNHSSKRKILTSTKENMKIKWR